MIVADDRRPPGRTRADARDLAARPAARGLPHRHRPRRRPDAATARSTPRARPTACTGSPRRIDSNGFGATPGLRRAGPARDRLPRARRHDGRRRGAAGALLRRQPGTSRRSRTRPTGRPPSEANASSVGPRARPLPRAQGRLHRSRPATRCGSSARTPARSASAPCPPRPRAPRSRSAPTARSASSAPDWPARTRGCGSRPAASAASTQTFPAIGPVGQLGRHRGLHERRPDRGLPRSPRRLRRRARQAPVPQLADRARVALQREQPVQRAPSARRARARTTSASRWSRTARCWCSPRACSSNRGPKGASKGVA